MSSELFGQLSEFISTEEKVINRLCNHLIPDGYLFTGHSETISGINVPLEIVENTVSRRL